MKSLGYLDASVHTILIHGYTLKHIQLYEHIFSPRTITGGVLPKVLLRLSSDILH